MRQRQHYQIAICQECQGCGVSSAYLGAFSQEQMQDDPEFAEAYFAGEYDRACPECQGRGRVYVLDVDNAPAEMVQEYQEQMEYEAEQREYARLRERGIEF